MRPAGSADKRPLGNHRRLEHPVLSRYGLDGVSQSFNAQSRAFDETPVSRRLVVCRQSAETVLKNGIEVLFSPLNMG